MNDTEKRCVLESHKFAKEAAEAIGFTRGTFDSMGMINLNAAFIGQLAAERFKGCIEQAAPSRQGPKASPNRQ